MESNLRPIPARHATTNITAATPYTLPFLFLSMTYDQLATMKNPGARHSAACASAPLCLPPARASPSAAAAGSAAPFFTHANPSAAFPLAHSASSAAPGTVFAPPSGAVLGFTHVEEPSGKYFRAEIVPGNALAHAFIPGAPPDDLDTHKF